jgi:indolepyruvate ferredoxin oxidoreductase alpha subunit
MTEKLLLGNEALALGLVEAGCRVVTAYPGTPSSEIMAGVIKLKKEGDREIYAEWSTNEKVAFEVALAASWTGLRSAVAMKQVGLNVAADPLFSSAYTGIQGGFIIIPADDPGPLSSQTEQDSRLLALSAKIPVFDPSSPREAREIVSHAFELSEKFMIPVMIRPTTRLCHALQSIPVNGVETENSIPNVRFKKGLEQWTATPKIRNKLHVELNRKLKEIEEIFNSSHLNQMIDDGISTQLGVVASGVAFQTLLQALTELDVRIPVLKIGTPFPLPQKLVREFISSVDNVLVLEEPDATIELQINNRTRVHGRLNGTVPSAGELSPEIVMQILSELLGIVSVRHSEIDLTGIVDQAAIPARPPRLCPGCSHRSAFFSMKREFGPRAIYPGDIGCYTLGTNLRAVDTFVDMGASITMADGLYQAGKLVGDNRPIVATIGDSTFIHSGIEPLINAVHTGSRFVLIILDNHTTAMTGRQPTAQSDFLAAGEAAPNQASIPDLVKSCGVRFVEITDPYEQESFQSILRRAYEFSEDPDGGIAVVIADRPCVLYDSAPVVDHPIPVEITAECDGCRYCVEAFECPAIVLRADGSRVDIDESICIECGQCIDACYKGFIIPAFPDFEKIEL